jgi:hypothetical protein
MRALFGNTLAILLLLAPVLQVLGQGASNCNAASGNAALGNASSARLSFFDGAAADGNSVSAEAGCCSQKSAPGLSLSPACGAAHQCCAPEAPMPEQPLAVVENRTAPSAELKAFVEHSETYFSGPRAVGHRPVLRTPARTPTNALRCSLIQRWRI